jgi:rhodanese-related sulfurtransferase
MEAPQDIDLEPRRVAQLYRDDRVELVDVREPYEWEAGRIAGARHIELGRLAEEAASLAPDRPIVFYCRVGGRSATAADAFRRAGYEAFNMAGGLEAWQAEGLPLEPEGGEVAPH